MKEDISRGRMSRRMDEPAELTPEQFEEEVEKQITSMGVGLSEF